MSLSTTECQTRSLTIDVHTLRAASTASMLPFGVMEMLNVMHSPTTLNLP